MFSPRSLLLASVMSVSALGLAGLGHHVDPTAFNASSAPSWANKPFIWVMWNGERHRAALLDQEGDRIRVHYLSYDSSSDEWIPRSRIVK